MTAIVATGSGSRWVVSEHAHRLLIRRDKSLWWGRSWVNIPAIVLPFWGIDMKTIGIVGGIAWPSSIVYYRIINELVAQRLGDGGLHSASLVLAQTDFEEIERNQREGRWDLVGDLLAEQGNNSRRPARISSYWPATPSTPLLIGSRALWTSRSCTSSIRPLARFSNAGS
jgi:hypothetical protein